MQQHQLTTNFAADTFSCLYMIACYRATPASSLIANYCDILKITNSGNVFGHVNCHIFNLNYFFLIRAGTILLVFALFLMLALVKMNLTSTGLGYSITNPFGQPSNQESLRINFWEAPEPKCGTVVDDNSVTSRLPIHSRDRQSHLKNIEIKLIRDDPICLKNICPNTSFCYLGACFCHPGYEGKDCSLKKEPSNPWYTKHCPNLLSTNTANMTVPLHMLGGEYSQPDHDSREGSADNSSSSSIRINRNKCEGSVNQKACAYLCYSHPAYGTAVVPHSLWHAALNAEGM